MNCVVHPDVAATAYCRSCGKALCPACQRDVRGVIYCEDCLAARVSGEPAAAAAPGVAPTVVVTDAGASPVIAGLLGMIPGVGAMYNGQFFKALIHVVVFATLIWGADHTGPFEAFFGIGIAFWWFYMVFDAVKTAKARLLGLPLPDFFGFERMWPGSVSGASVGGRPVAPPQVPFGPASASAASAVPGNPGAVAPVSPVVAPVMPPPDDFRRAPVGAIVLIAIGVLFLLDTMGFWHWHWFGRFWPVVLIVMGVWIWIRRRPVAE